MIDTDHWLIRRNLYYVHAVNIHELFIFGHSSTSHTGFLCILIKEVLECDRCKSLRLSVNLYMLLCLDCLMKTIRITTSRHNTSGKFINDKNFVVFYYVISVSEHKVMCTKSKNNIMLNLKVLCIRKVLDMEELLYLLNTLCCKHNLLILLVNKEISIFLNINTHDGINLRKFTIRSTTLHLSCKDITCLIKICGLTTLTGNDKRGSCLIDQYGIDLIDNGIIQFSLYKILLINNHVVTKVIET